MIEELKTLRKLLADKDKDLRHLMKYVIELELKLEHYEGKANANQPHYS